jgi:hypothetical protein
MAVERPGKAVRCVACGKTDAEKQGSNNWKMCDKCFATYCLDCYRSVKKSSSACADHQLWGKWLTGHGTFATMKFS